MKNGKPNVSLNRDPNFPDGSDFGGQHLKKTITPLRQKTLNNELVDSIGEAITGRCMHWRPHMGYHKEAICDI